MGQHLLTPEESRWLVEYRACKTFGWTHEQYITTPSYAVQWLLSIASIESALEAEQTAKARREAAR